MNRRDLLKLTIGAAAAGVLLPEVKAAPIKPIMVRPKGMEYFVTGNDRMATIVASTDVVCPRSSPAGALFA